MLCAVHMRRTGQMSSPSDGRRPNCYSLRDRERGNANKGYDHRNQAIGVILCGGGFALFEHLIRYVGVCIPSRRLPL